MKRTRIVATLVFLIALAGCGGGGSTYENPDDGMQTSTDGSSDDTNANAEENQELKNAIRQATQAEVTINVTKATASKYNSCTISTYSVGVKETEIKSAIQAIHNFSATVSKSTFTSEGYKSCFDAQRNAIFELKRKCAELNNMKVKCSNFD